MLSAHDAEIVRRDADLPGLAVLLDIDAFLDVLSQEFPLLEATAADIVYLRYKPRTSCLCSYRVRGAGGSFDVYAKAFTRARGEKLRHWRSDARSAGGRRRRRASEPWHLGISRFPDDRRLKALGRLQDPSSRDRILCTTFGFDRYVGPTFRSGADHEHSGLTTLRYKPERRYVASLTDEGVPAAVLKMYDSFGYRLAQARARVFHAREALLVPVCVGESGSHRLLGFEWVAGRGLHEELAQCGRPDAAELAGVALAELHDQDNPMSLSTHGGAAARAVHAAAESVAAVSPALASRVRLLAHDIASRLDERSRCLRPSHGDFHAEQVIVAGSRVAILDFDRACLAHPAADLGTFAAHLHQAVMRGVFSDAQAGLEGLIAGYGRLRPAPLPAQLGAYTAAALLRLAPEPFRRHEPGWPELTERVLERAAQALAPQAQDVRKGSVAGGSKSGVAVADAHGLADDPAWSFLRSALDPSKARPYLDGPLARLDAAAHATLREIRVSRHKPGRRCVVEYTFDAGAGTHGADPLVVVGKSRMKGLNANAHFALESLWNAGFTPSRSSVCVPQPLGAVPAWRMTLQRKVNGDAAGERLASAGGVRVAARIAEAIYTLHTRGVAPARRHTVDDELQILRGRLRQVHELAGVSRIERLLDRCERLASELPRCRPQPVHRDFYPAHVLVDGDRLWLIDLDLYCAGDPAVDVGNFLAHMIEERLRRDGIAEGLTETEAAFESRYVQLAGRHVLPAIRAYTTLSLVRQVHLSTQYPERRHTTRVLLDLCERRLLAGLESKLYA